MVSQEFILHVLLRILKKTFQVISNDILDVADCAIYFDIKNGINKDEVQDDELLNMNLIIVPITRQFLTNSNMVLDYILPFAKREHIPILPIVN